MLLEKLFEEEKIDKITFDKTQEDIKRSKETEEKMILKAGIISEQELFELKSKILDIPIIFKENFSPRVLRFIPFNIANDKKIIPIKKKGNFLHIGMIYPEDQNAHEFINQILKKNKLIAEIYLISFSEFRSFLKEYKTTKIEIQKEVSKISQIEEKKPIMEETLSMLEDAPVIKIVNVILEQAVEGGASDIHIEPTDKETRVRFRVIGKLYHSITLPFDLSFSIISRIKILANLKIDETRRPQDGRFSMIINNRKIDFRVATLPVQNREKITLRILDLKKELLPNIDNIGFLKKEIKAILKEIKKPYGLILISGPTGSGKTTTLLALLSELNKEDVNIVTMEDPIEYIMNGVNQSQINHGIGYTFASGLRSVLRQDPDIIMVGETRDRETAGLLINAALTGHLVLSTLHTNDVIGIIPRLIDMGVDPFLVAPVFNIAISQRLIKVLCANCKQKQLIDSGQKTIIKNSISALFDGDLKIKYLDLLNKNLYLYKPVGCSKCNKLGYSDRIAITEILHINQEFARLISKGPTEGEIKEQTKKQKMVTMQQNGMMKVLDGTTTIEEVLNQTKEK